MIASNTLSIHPFWRFSVKVYADQLVEQNLLLLQDQYGLNINVLLFCMWHAISDQGQLSKVNVSEMLFNIEKWHRNVIEPLRQIRRELKEIKQSPWCEVREDLLQSELVGEHIEQLLILQNFNYKTELMKNDSLRLIDACKNIQIYCDCLKIQLGQEVCQALAKVLGVLFNQIDHQIILRYCIDTFATC